MQQSVSVFVTQDNTIAIQSTDFSLGKEVTIFIDPIHSDIFIQAVKNCVMDIEYSDAIEDKNDE